MGNFNLNKIFIMDKYKWDLVYNQAKSFKKEIAAMLDERKALSDKQQPTGGIDHRLKSKSEQLRKELNSLEKIVYFYENNDESVKDVSDKDKKKRASTIKPFIEECKHTQGLIKNLFD